MVHRGNLPNKKATAALASSITKASSRQSYFIARLLVDKDLVDDCLRAYAYFRWADDIIDISAQSPEERIAFIRRQRGLISRLYRGDRAGDLSPEEHMIADLISHDRGENSGLQSFIRNFLEILEFDSFRKGRGISQAELTWYSNCLGKSVTDAIQYFVGNGHPYPDAKNRYRAAAAAHITHMLRDMDDDIAEGFVNIPREWLQEHGHSLENDDLTLEDLDSKAFRSWVHGRVALARKLFREGKRYLDELEVLRCKIAGYWYSARFECVLDAIERDGYILRPRYDERRRLSTRLRLVWVAVSLTLRHVVGRGWRSSLGRAHNSNLEAAVTGHE